MRISKEQLESANRNLSEDNTKLLHAVQALAEGEVNWYFRSTVHGETYRFGVSHLTTAHGGLLYIRYSTKEQKPSTTVHYLETYEAMQKFANPSDVEYMMHVTALNKAIGLRHDAFVLERNAEVLA
jgi:hypothetical protein